MLTLEDELIGVGRTTIAIASLSTPAPSGGTTITLSIDDPAIATLSTLDLLLAEGQSTAEFTLTGSSPGATVIRGNGPGLTEATAAVTVVATLISIDEIEIVAPNQSTSVVISITDPAPPQGLEIQLEVLDSTIASLSPTTLFVPAGQLTPLGNSQLTGLALGTTSVRATAPGYAADIRDVTVAINAEFDPTSIDVPETRARTVVITLDAPAPIGGATFALALDAPLVTVPTQITIAQGQTQSLPITLTAGSTIGTTQLRATATGFVPLEASVSVTDLPDAFLRQAGASNHLVEAIVGKDLQTQVAVRLETIPTSPVDIAVSIPAGSSALLSSNINAAGGTSLLFEDVTGTITPSFWIQGLELTDDIPLTIEVFERNTTTPAEYAPRPSTIDVDPGGMYFLTSVVNQSAFSPDATVSLRIGVLHDSESGAIAGNFRARQRPRGGLTLPVGLVSSDPTVAELVNPIATFGTQDIASSTVDILAQGTTQVSIASFPAGFGPTANQASAVVVTINAPDAYLNGSNGTSHATEAMVGQDLQRSYRVVAEDNPPTPVDIVVSVPAGSGALLSTTPNDVGANSISMAGVTSRFGPNFVIQGVTQGDDVPLTIEIFAAGTTTPIGYNIRPSTVDIDPSGIYFSTTAISGNAFGANPNLTAWVGVLWDEPPIAPGTLREPQRPRAGVTVTMALTSSAPTVAQATGVLTFVTNSQTSVPIDLLSAGVTTISGLLPAGFVVPTGRSIDATVTVDAPDAYLRGSNTGYVGEAVVGLDLQAAYSIRMESAPPEPVDVHVSVPGGSGVLLATDPVAAGATSLTYDSVSTTNTPSFFIQGAALGDDVAMTIEIFVAGTTIPVGFNVLPSTVDIDPSGIHFTSASVTTTTFSPNGNLTLRTGVLYDTEGPPIVLGNLRTQQAVRGGASIDVGLQSSVPTVASLVNPLATLNSNATQALVPFNPQTAGSTVISITSFPPGFSAPANQPVAATILVDAPDTRLLRPGAGQVFSARIGDELQQRHSVQLEVVPPNPVDVTVEIIDPSVATVSTDQATAGSASITFPSITSTVTPSIWIQGLSVNTATQLRITAPGYDDRVIDVSVAPAGFYLPGGLAPVAAGSTRNIPVNVGTLNANQTLAAQQEVRGGASFTVAVTSSNAAVASVPVSVTMANGQSSATIAATGQSPGTVTISLTQPSGFTPPAGRGDVSLTVN